jgi:predicted pore-forming effector associated with SMODS systems
LQKTVPNLYYDYVSKPGAYTVPLMQMHHGTGHLSLSSDGKTLTGEYYVGRDRVTYGTLELYFVSKKKVNRDEALKHLTQ